MPRGRDRRGDLAMTGAAGFVGPLAAGAAQRSRSAICRVVTEVSDVETPYSWCSSGGGDVALLLIHPVGVGLSRKYWGRFLQAYDKQEMQMDAFAPDLLGCGENKKADQLISVEMVASNLKEFVATVVKKPVIIQSEGALLTAALRLAKMLEPTQVRGMVAVAPPSLRFLSREANETVTRLVWAGFTSPLGTALFSYIRRREFLRQFSEKNLLYGPAGDEWLDDLEEEAQDASGRFVAFSFLCGEWTRDFRPLMQAVDVPVLILMGDKTRPVQGEPNQPGDDPQGRVDAYREQFRDSSSQIFTGKSVLSYEFPEKVLGALRPFLEGI